jgi:hypothetical protein
MKEYIAIVRTPATRSGYDLEYLFFGTTLDPVVTHIAHNMNMERAILCGGVDNRIFESCKRCVREGEMTIEDVTRLLYDDGHRKPNIEMTMRMKRKR